MASHVNQKKRKAEEEKEEEEENGPINKKTLFYYLNEIEGFFNPISIKGFTERGSFGSRYGYVLHARLYDGNEIVLKLVIINDRPDDYNITWYNKPYSKTFETEDGFNFEIQSQQQTYVKTVPSPICFDVLYSKIFDSASAIAFLKKLITKSNTIDGNTHTGVGALYGFINTNIIKMFNSQSTLRLGVIAMEYGPRTVKSNNNNEIFQMCALSVITLLESKLVGCDLKMDNFVYDKDGNMRIIDFGSMVNYIDYKDRNKFKTLHKNLLSSDLTFLNETIESFCRSSQKYDLLDKILKFFVIIEITKRAQSVATELSVNTIISKMYNGNFDEPSNFEDLNTYKNENKNASSFEAVIHIICDWYNKKTSQPKVAQRTWPQFFGFQGGTKRGHKRKSKKRGTVKRKSKKSKQ
jgi:hypothetical protein